MKSYKILIVTDAWHPQVNGVVRTLSYLVKELKKAEARCTFNNTTRIFNITLSDIS